MGGQLTQTNRGLQYKRAARTPAPFQRRRPSSRLLLVPFLSVIPLPLISLIFSCLTIFGGSTSLPCFAIFYSSPSSVYSLASVKNSGASGPFTSQSETKAKRLSVGLRHAHAKGVKTTRVVLGNLFLDGLLPPHSGNFNPFPEASTARLPSCPQDLYITADFI